ncbi:MAG: hypothetical protein U0264_03045 [Candidatus Kapaibacterium sp.]
MKKLFLTLTTAIGVAAFTPPLTAQIPRTLTVQGVLSDSLSRPVMDGVHRISIRIYDRQTGGNSLYFEEFTTQVFEGLFNLTLGAIKPLPKSLGFDKQYYLGISYDGKQEMPRIPLSSVPYALIAETVADGAITGSKIADGTITSDKLSPDLALSLKLGEKTLGNTFTPPAFVGGGNNNIASGSYSTIGAGLQNTASGGYSAIMGGHTNTASGNYSALGGGQSNAAQGAHSALAGGSNNSSAAQYSAIGGGYSNSINSNSTAGLIAGGYDNTIATGSQYASIGGGLLNTASAQYAHVSGGRVNTASGNYSSVVGGWSNSVSGLYSFIGGGYNNTVSGEFSSIPGGKNNTISGDNAFINGGVSNSVSGENAAVLGGANNSVGASGGIVLGNNLAITNSATNAIVIGSGPSAGSKLTSASPNSLTIAFNSNIATVFVDKANGSGGIGKVGFGNSNPLTMIDMTGVLTMRSIGQSEPAVSPLNQGRIYFDEVTGRFRVSENGGPYQDLMGEGRGGGGGGWLLTGNAGIIEGTNYLGPNNDAYLDLRAGDGEGGSITRLLLNTNGSIQRSIDGDPRGDEAIDLQTFRSSSDQVASGLYSVLTGGQLNSVSGIASVVSGGQQNNAEDILNFIGGGTNNDVRGAFNSIVGGGGNSISFDAQISSILGGGDNEINGHEGGIIGSVIGGGDFNTINSDYGFIGGGTEHIVDGTGAVIAGGGAIEDDGQGGFNYFGNTASGNYSGILGGADNTTNSQYASIGGGRGNTASGDYSVIGGGLTNTTLGLTSTVSGGSGNRANGDNSTVSGGEQNYAFGEFSTIPGGRMMTLTTNAARSFGFNGNSSGAVRDITIDAPNTAVWNNVDFWLTNNDGAPRTLRFYGLYDAIGAFPNGTQYVGFKAPNTIATSVTWTLPDADGTDGQFLKTDGNGALSWATAGGLQHFVESENTTPPNSEGVPVVQFLASSVSTNVDVALTPKGTGALLAQIPDMATTGGNKRGLQSVDWQMLRSNALQVASGNRSVISGGESNRASATNSTVGGGQANTASNTGSTVGGGTSNTASGFMSTISGGTTNTAGSYSAIPGGTALQLGQRSFGYNANLDSSNFNVRPMAISQSNVAVFNNVDFWLTNNDNTTRSLRMYEQNNVPNGFPGTTNFVGFKAPNSIPADVTWTLPDADGADGQFLKTNGSGALSWATASGGLTHFTESANTAAPNNGVPVVQLLATNASTDVDVALTPKGIGALTGHVADNTSAGGNKRGANAIDWQTTRSNATQVASGQNATIGGGSGNTSSNLYTTVSGGEQNVASGVQSTVSGGFFNVASGERSTVSGGIINTASGDYSTIVGGRGLTLSGIGSVGYHNNTNGTNDMVVADNGTAVLGNTDLWLASNDNTPRSLRFFAQNNTPGAFPGATNFVGFKAPDVVTTSVTYTLPPADGAAGDQLTTDGAGNLSWAPPSIPCGGIIMWQGDINNVPTGWALCDGTNGTPNLNDRFPRGTTSSVSVGILGGQDTHSHTVDDHSHAISTLTATGSVDNGNITGSTDNSTTGITASATLDAGNDVTTDGTTNTLSSTSTVNITDNGHGHGVSGSLSSTSVTITSVSGNTDNSTGVGTNQADNIPAFVYVGFIMRVCQQ